MNIQSLKKQTPWLVPATLLLILAGLLVARAAFAKVVFNTIDPVGIVAGQGRHVTLTGPLAFTAGETAHLRVTVTQRSTGALAEGEVLLTGNGQTNQWEVTAAVQGRKTFAPGPATAVALARPTLNGNATDAHQWLVNITLVKE
jgi:hypothetical protein